MKYGWLEFAFGMALAILAQIFVATTTKEPILLELLALGWFLRSAAKVISKE